MTVTVIETLLNQREEVSVKGVKIDVPSAYAPHVQDKEVGSSISSNREARQDWVRGFVGQLSQFRTFLQLDAQLKRKEQDDEYNIRVEEFSGLLARYRYLASNVKNSLRDSNLTLQEFKDLYYRDFKSAEDIRKKCEAIKKVIEALEAKQKAESENEQARKESRLATRDDVAQDPHVFDTQIELAYGHPNANPSIKNSSVEFAITTLFPAIDEFLEAEHAFLKNQDSFFGKNAQFVSSHTGFVIEAKQEIKRLKQGLAGAAFNRLNSELISPTFPKERFETFVEYVKEHGNFVVVNVPRADIDELDGFINTEKTNNKKARGSWFARFIGWFAGKKYISETEYKKRESYLDSLKKQVTEHKADLRALQEDRQFAVLMEAYIRSELVLTPADELPANATYAALIQGDIARCSREGFSTYIENKINALEAEKQQKVGFFARIFGSKEKTQFDEQIEYLQKLKQAIDSTTTTQYLATESIKLVVDTHSADQNPYSVQFFNSYNDHRGGNRRLCPNGLMQLANEVINFSQEKKTDFFEKLLRAFNEKYPGAKIELDKTKTDQEARHEALLKLLVRKQDFADFVRDFKPDYDHDSGVMFSDYLKRFALELENPYRTLADRTDTRISTSYDCLVDILLNHGVNSELITVVNNYIEMVRYAVQQNKINVAELSHVQAKINSNNTDEKITPEEAKNNFLSALNLVQAIVEGKFAYWDVENKKEVSLKDTDHKELISKLCEYVLPNASFDSKGINQVYSSEYLFEKFTKFYLQESLNNSCRERSVEANAHSYIQLLDDQLMMGEDTYAIRYQEASNRAYQFFAHLFCNNPHETNKAKQESIEIGKEDKLLGDVLDLGESKIKRNLASVQEQQNLARLHDQYNEGKRRVVQLYVDKYDGSNTVYAEVITIVGTEAQIKQYAKKLLEAVFVRAEVKLTPEQEKFIKDNKDILESIIHNILDGYISNQKYQWSAATEKVIHQIGSDNNKQRYANKKIKELLDVPSQIEAEARIRMLQKKASQFVYPDLQDNQAYTELLNIFSIHVSEGKYSFAADSLADYLLQKQNPEVLQQLRINMLDGFLLQCENLKAPGEAFIKLFPEALRNQKNFLDAVIAFITHVNQIASTHGVLVHDKETELYKVGKEKIDIIFSKFLAKNKYFEYAERLACAFDEDKNALQELRIRKVQMLLKENNLEKTQQYIKFVAGSTVPEFLCVQDGVQRLDKLFREAIEKEEIHAYVWNSTIDALVKAWGNDLHKDLCVIAKLATHFIYDNTADVLQVEQYISQLKEKKIVTDQLVVTEEGKQKLISLLQQAMQSEWNPKVELLIEYFEPASNQRALLHEYRTKRFAEIMKNKGARYRSTNLEIENDLLKENHLFARDEHDRYLSLKPYNGTNASFTNLLNYFGEEGLQEVRELLAEYVDSFRDKDPEELNLEHYDVNHYDLCLLILTKELATKPIGQYLSKPELYGAWNHVLRQHGSLKKIAVHIAAFEDLLLQGIDGFEGGYEKALGKYREQMNRKSGAVANNVASEIKEVEKVLQGIENCVIKIIKENIFSSNVDALNAIKTEFLDKFDEAFKQDFQKECLRLINVAKFVKEAYEFVVKNLDQILAKEMPKNLIQDIELLVNFKAIGNQQKEQLLARITTARAVSQPIENADLFFNLLETALQSNEIDEDLFNEMQKEFTEYSKVVTQFNKAYQKIQTALDSMRIGGKLDFLIEDFSLILKYLNAEQKTELLKKVNDLKQAFENKVVPNFGEPSAILSLLTTAVQEGNIPDGFQAEFKEYQAKFESQSTSFCEAFTKVNAILAAMVNEEKFNFAELIENIKYAFPYLSERQKATLVKNLNDASKENVLAKIETEAFPVREICRVLVGSIGSGDMDNFDAKCEMIQIEKVRARYQAAIKDCKPYVGFIDDCRILAIDLEKEEKSLESRIKQSKCYSFKVGTIYAALKDHSDFFQDKKPISKTSQKFEMSLNYLAQLLMLEQLKIAGITNDVDKVKKIATLQESLRDFFDKKVSFNQELQDALKDRFSDVILIKLVPVESRNLTPQSTPIKPKTNFWQSEGSSPSSSASQLPKSQPIPIPSPAPKN